MYHRFMQLPYRKPPTFTPLGADPHITAQKLAELKNKLAKLLAGRPHLADEVHRLAQNGDFSENAEYQTAKGRLRGVNDSIARLEHQINNAVLINQSNTDEVAIGHTVTVLCDGKERTFHILGSSETNPKDGVISYNSPIGSALLGHPVGSTVTITLPTKKLVYEIVRIL